MQGDQPSKAPLPDLNKEATLQGSLECVPSPQVLLRAGSEQCSVKWSDEAAVAVRQRFEAVNKEHSAQWCD